MQWETPFQAAVGQISRLISPSGCYLFDAAYCSIMLILQRHFTNVSKWGSGKPKDRRPFKCLLTPTFCSHTFILSCSPLANWPVPIRNSCLWETVSFCSSVFRFWDLFSAPGSLQFHSTCMLFTALGEYSLSSTTWDFLVTILSVSDLMNAILSHATLKDPFQCNLGSVLVSICCSKNLCIFKSQICTAFWASIVR